MDTRKKQQPPFGLRIQKEEVKQWLEKKADEEGRSLNNLINRILDQAMKEETTKEKRS